MNNSKKIEVGKIINEGQKLYSVHRYKEAAEKCSEAIKFLDRELKGDSKSDLESDALRIRLYVARGSSYAGYNRLTEAVDDYNKAIAFLNKKTLNNEEKEFLAGVNSALEEVLAKISELKGNIEN